MGEKKILELEELTEKLLLEQNIDGNTIYTPKETEFLTKHAPWRYGVVKPDSPKDQPLLKELMILVFKKTITLDNAVYTTHHSTKFDTEKKKKKNLFELANSKLEKLNPVFEYLGREKISRLNRNSSVLDCLQKVFEIKKRGLDTITYCFNELVEKNLQTDEKEFNANEKELVEHKNILMSVKPLNRLAVFGTGSYFFPTEKDSSDIDGVHCVKDLTFELFLYNALNSIKVNGLELKANLVDEKNFKALAYCDMDHFYYDKNKPLVGKGTYPVPKKEDVLGHVCIQLAERTIGLRKFLSKSDKELKQILQKVPRVVYSELREPGFCIDAIRGFDNDFEAPAISQINFDEKHPPSVAEARKMLAKAVVDNYAVVSKFIQKYTA
ncbi:hypothetical protein JXA85_01725 [Candidatus Woesearchaeota archaeon]|nr:hypothetical protein [Candidatus Woesearchaeota archaeon]